jgi:DNA replication and repair protein RecF
MPLLRLQATDFRCLQAIDLELDPAFTLISGPNASGKTSILEAIYVLGRGRSFRTRLPEHLVRQSSDRFVVFGEVRVANRDFGMGIEAGKLGARARIDGRSAKALSELALALPVQVIDPEVHKLIEEAPSRRRRFVDWGVFHVEPQFAFHWQRYQQALRQRNAALRARHPHSVVAAWDPDLIASGEFVTHSRRDYVDRLQTSVESVSTAMLGQPLTIRYRTGWSKDLSLEQALTASWALDRDRGVTQSGPQRADLVVEFDGHRARDRVSRGQQKMVAAALLLAQLTLFSREASVPTLLLDDPAAELDSISLNRLIDQVRQLSAQLVVTSLQPESSAFGTPGRRYSIGENHIVDRV